MGRAPTSSLTKEYAVGYISLCRIAVKIFECDATHPSFAPTSVPFPDKTCEEGAEYHAFGFVGIFLYIILILGVYSYVAYIAPARYADEVFRRGTAFLFGRWQRAVWWFTPVTMLRNLAVALIPVVYPTDGAMQLGWTQAVVVVYLIAQSVFSPWKVRSINGADAVTSGSIVMVCGFVLSIGAIPISREMIVTRTDDYSVFCILPLVAAFLALPYAFFFVLWQTGTTASSRALEKEILPLLTRAVELLARVPDDTLFALPNVLTGSEMDAFKNVIGVLLHEVFMEKIPGVTITRRLFVQQAVDMPVQLGTFESRRAAGASVATPDVALTQEV